MVRFGVRGVAILIGFTAAIAQIVLMRELLVVFRGNEISIGLMLAGWLACTAAGSAAGGRIASRVRDPRRLAGTLEMLVSIALPAAILIARASRPVLETVPGESLGPGPMALTSLLALGAFCGLAGALFPAAGRLSQTADLAAATGSVYWLEALGSAAGGMLAAVLLVEHLGSLEIAAGLAVMNLLAAAWVGGRRRAWVPALLLIVPVAAVWLEPLSLEHLWRGFHLLAARNSAYGNLAVVSTDGVRTLYENGLPLFHAPDPAAAEEAVHYALLEAPAPRSLLMIGGGLNGSLAEALKHRGLERIDYVELDPAVLELARSYFPGSLPADPRVRVHAVDGRLFLKTAAERFDAIVVNLPDPQTAQLNRFYTLEFFREAAGRLTPGGVLSFQLTGSENYIGPELAGFLRSIDKTLRMVFPEVAAMPGETVHFFAAKRKGVLAGGADELLARLRARGIETSYVREYYIPYRMMPDRVAELDAAIRPRPDTPVNRDFAPIAYYFDMALWSARFHPEYREVLGAMAAIRFGTVALVFALLAGGAVAGVWLLKGERRMRAVAGACAGGMGFTLIGIEILLLLAFQAIYGYMYQQLAVILGAFMAGMAGGGWAGVRKTHTGRNACATFPEGGLQPAQGFSPACGRSGTEVPRGLKPAPLSAVSQCGTLGSVQIVGALAPLAFCAVFAHVGQGMFPVLALVAGALGGYAFPVASGVFFGPGKGHRAGTLYALDLAGSCVGALLFSAWLVPVFGFTRTALLMAIAGAAPAAMAFASARTPAR